MERLPFLPVCGHRSPHRMAKEDSRSPAKGLSPRCSPARCSAWTCPTVKTCLAHISGKMRQAFHPHRPRRQGVRRVVALRFDEGAHHLPRKVRTAGRFFPRKDGWHTHRTRPGPRIYWATNLSTFFIVMSDEHQDELRTTKPAPRLPPVKNTLSRQRRISSPPPAPRSTTSRMQAYGAKVDDLKATRLPPRSNDLKDAAMPPRRASTVRPPIREGRGTPWAGRSRLGRRQGPRAHGTKKTGKLMSARIPTRALLMAHRAPVSCWG